MSGILEALAIIVGGFVVLPILMILAAYLFILWLAGLNWIGKKIDDFLCNLFWGDENK